MKTEPNTRLYDPILSDLFAKQEVLTTTIMRAHPHFVEDAGGLLSRMLLALYAEFGEMVHEVSSEEAFLEEAVDVLHFLISVTQMLGFDHHLLYKNPAIAHYTKTGSWAKEDELHPHNVKFDEKFYLERLICNMSSITNLCEWAWKYWKKNPRQHDKDTVGEALLVLWWSYLHYTYGRGATIARLYQEYSKKNQINHERVQNAY